MNKYIVDSDSLIQSKNGPYDFEIAPPFWDLIVNNNQIFSSYMVYKELIKGKDRLAQWAKLNKNSGLFLNPNPQDQKVYGKIGHFVVNNYPQEESSYFLNGADPWIIAQAKNLNAIVVTHEVLVNSYSKKVKIPNICNEFGLKCINIYQMLQGLQFVFK